MSSSTQFWFWPFWKVWWHPRPRAPAGQWHCCCRCRWGWRGLCSPAWSAPEPNTSSSRWTPDSGPFWNGMEKMQLRVHIQKRKYLVMILNTNMEEPESPGEHGCFKPSGHGVNHVCVLTALLSWNLWDGEVNHTCGTGGRGNKGSRCANSHVLHAECTCLLAWGSMWAQLFTDQRQR